MSDFYDDISGHSNPSFRLLTLDPSSDPDTPLSCSLSTHAVDANPDYEALSYVWGDASNKVPITCNGQPREITINLWHALRNCRRTLEDDAQYGSRVIWADAICINQADKYERSTQVQFMGDIYRRAVRTIIYLGERDAASDLVMQLCYYLEEASEKGEQAPSITDKRVILDNLLEFFKRPWWTRSWIIQELCLSRDPGLVAGNVAVSWRLFARVIGKIQEEIRTGDPSDMGLLERMLKLMRSDGYVAARALEAEKTKLADDAYQTSMIEMLADFKNFGSTDPRDKVYGLLGLATEEERAAIRPDYTISTVQCYTNAAAAILKLNQDLGLLETLSLFQRYRDPNLPSWVPQWDSESQVEEVGMRLAGHIRSVAHTNQTLEQPGANQPFNASRSRQTSRLEFTKPNILALDGLVVDTIKAAGIPLTFPTEMHDGMAKLSGLWSMQTLQFFYSGATQLGQVNEALEDWEKLAMENTSYPTGEDPKRVLLATLYGHDADLDEAETNFDTAMETHIRKTGLTWGVRSALGGISSTSKHLFLGVLSMRTSTKANTFECLPKCWDKRLGRTEKGYLVLLPETAEVGDSVVLLPGGTKPFILRAVGGRWRVIGICYVHGIMNGEAWDASKVGRLELV